VCKAGLRVLKKSGGWNERCRDQMTLLVLETKALTPEAEKTTEEMEAPAPQGEEMTQDQSIVLSTGFIVSMATVLLTLGLVITAILLYRYRSSVLQWCRGCEGYSGNVLQ